MEDAQIIRLLFDRTEAALTALSERFGSRLYRTALNILGDPQDAQEAVNDTYLALWNAIPPSCPDPLAGFVLQTGRNTALNHLRRSRARKRDTSFDLSLDELAGCIPGGCLEDALNARLLGRAISRFLDALPGESRVLFLRRYYFGDSVGQIAKALGLRENTVSVRLSRLRQKLKDQLILEELYDEA